MGTLVEAPHARDELELTAEQPLDQTLVDQLETQVHDENVLDSHPSIARQATVTAEPLRLENPGPVAFLPLPEVRKELEKRGLPTHGGKFGPHRPSEQGYEGRWYLSWCHHSSC